jgi:pyruvyltransferase
MRLPQGVRREVRRVRDLRRVRQVPGGIPAFWFTGRPNFGDLISPILVAGTFAVRPVLVGSSFPGKLLGAGSILHRAVPGDVVWGSGLIEEQPFDGSQVEFLAVRGPRSQKCIHGDVPNRFGDPGMLLPRLYNPKRTDTRFDVGVMPHYHDADTMRVCDDRVLMIRPEASDWRRTVDNIVACDVVVTSSLHGIIAADAYGVPVVWVQPTGGLKGGQFKFHDYYEGTDREARLSNWSEGLTKIIDNATEPPMLDLSGLLDPLAPSKVASLQGAIHK